MIDGGELDEMTDQLIKTMKVGLLGTTHRLSETGISEIRKIVRMIYDAGREDGEMAMIDRLTQGPISQEEGAAAKARGLATLKRAQACVELRHMRDILPGQTHYKVTREQLDALIVDMTSL